MILLIIQKQTLITLVTYPPAPKVLTKKIIAVIVVVFLLVVPAKGQTTIGIPAIKNFPHTDYNASTEIWDARQDSNGILYFGNNDGLLTFDGTYWKIYPLPNKGPVRSLYIDTSGRIFVGGQDEIGYFFPNDNGVLKYHSIKNLLPVKARQFAEILSIVPHKNEIFFRTVECIFKYDGKTVKTFDALGGWRMLTVAGNQLFAEDRDEGLKIFKDNQWQTRATNISTAGIRVTSLANYSEDTVLVTTLQQGLFLLTGNTLIKRPTAADALLIGGRINCSQNIGDGRYAIGTASKGLFIINGKGKLVNHFTNAEGLQNNNIHTILLDREKNLWLGLENGLDLVNYNTSVNHIYPDKNNQLKSNAISIYNQQLYVGTTNGLYSTSLDAKKKDISANEGIFTEIAGIKGQVWSLNQIDGNLLVGHQDGSFIINHNAAKPVTEGQGVWQFKAIPGSADVVAGTYIGLQLLKYNNGNFSDESAIDGLYESLGNLAKDDDQTIWSSHPYRGVFKLELSADRKKIVRQTLFTDKNGLPSVLNNRVYFIRNKIIVATQKGIYEYNKANNRFEVSPFYNPIFDSSTIEYLTEDAQGNIWFISNQRVGVIDFHKPSASLAYTVIYFPELAGQTVKGSEFIYPYDAYNIFIGSNNGVFHLNYRQYVQTDTKLRVLLTTVKAIAEKDSLVFGGFFTAKGKLTQVQDHKQSVSLSNHWNSFHFEYSSTLFAQKSNEEFTYKLIGFDKAWSKWSAKTEKDYTNLPYGDYTFSVKVRNNLGTASRPINYSFIVEPAWYQTIWAYLLYLAALGYAVHLIVKYQQKRIRLQQLKHEEEQKQLTYLHGLELDRNDKEIIALKNENLETELNFKNKELATMTMHLVDRGRLFLDIKEEMTALIKKLNMPTLSYEFRSVFKLLNEVDKKDDDWNNFAVYFDQVHNNFLTVIKSKYPTLSSTDLKLCAYLRLNLSSKEIAQLLNISLKGVEISRYRLRKKLQLSTDINLYSFLTEVTNS